MTTIEPIIPYIISLAHPCYKRPWLQQIFGKGTIDEVTQNVLTEIYSYIYEFIYESREITVANIKKLYEEDIYRQYYMDNEPWMATAFIDGKWTDITPTYEELYLMYLECKQKIEKI